MVTSKWMIYAMALGVVLNALAGDWAAVAWSINACYAWYLIRQEDLKR